MRRRDAAPRMVAMGEDGRVEQVVERSKRDANIEGS